MSNAENAFKYLPVSIKNLSIGGRRLFMNLNDEIAHSGPFLKKAAVRFIFRAFQKPTLLMFFLVEATSRAGQAGGGSFKEKNVSQRRNLPIECAQGDQPLRCPNRVF